MFSTLMQYFNECVASTTEYPGEYSTKERVKRMGFRAGKEKHRPNGFIDKKNSEIDEIHHVRKTR